MRERENRARCKEVGMTVDYQNQLRGLARSIWKSL